MSVAYLISQEFMELAKEKSGNPDPSFYDLKDPFFLSENALGSDLQCPRDGRLGCALTDVVPRRYRGPCTHFLSWTWCYKVSVFQDALWSWVELDKLDPENIFLFCC